MCSRANSQIMALIMCSLCDEEALGGNQRD
jgi:hypothetical protein